MSKKRRGRKHRGARKITHQVGDAIIIHRDDFAEMIRRMEEYIGAAGGSCEDWCDEICSGDGGCRSSFGSPGDCGGICGNLEVYFQI